MTITVFSPKVLDRAFAIELDQVDLAGYEAGSTQSRSPMHLHKFPKELTSYRRPDYTDWQALGQKLNGELRHTLVELNQLLTEEHRQFGYRVANEIARFVNLASDQADARHETLWAALDIAIMQKVLPKFHGTQQELEAVLKSFFEFAVPENADPAGWKLVDGELQLTDATPDQTTPSPKLPRTAAKLWRMLNLVHRQGFASFIE